MSSASLVVMSKGTPYTQQSYKVGPALGWDGFGDMQHHDAGAFVAAFDVLRVMQLLALHASMSRQTGPPVHATATPGASWGARHLQRKLETTD
jgi:hypothetical protein